MIPIFFYDSLHSTNAKAREKALTHSPPFAVVAETQLSGRGQRGNIWHSPRGNLFFSLCFSQKEVGDLPIPWLSLKTAVLLSRQLYDTYGFQASIKWPNDIVYEGKKLGGILVESFKLYGEQPRFILGIGLNVLVASGKEGFYLPPISIQEIAPITSEPLLDQFKYFVSRFVSAWKTYSNRNLLGEYRKRHLLEGHLWYHETRDEYSIYEKIDDRGNLCLKSLKDLSHQVLFTSASRKRWQPIEKQALVFLCEIGNTTAKFAVFHGRDLKKVVYYATGSEEKKQHEIIEYLSRLRVQYYQPDYWPIWISDVNPDGVVKISKILRTYRWSLYSCNCRWILCPKSEYRFNQLGHDRILMIEGVYKRYMNPRGDTQHLTLVISAGTATTLDVLSPENGHLGGLILPGIGPYYDALFNATTLLKKQVLQFSAAELSRLEVNSSAIGCNTEQAIFQGWKSGIQGIIFIICKQYGCPIDKLQVILTGGFGETLQKHLSIPHKIYDSHLVFYGMLVQLNGG